MEIRDYVQIGSLLFTGLSVGMAYVGFSRSRIVQQISELRSNLSAAWAAAEELDDLLSSPSGVHLGKSIVEQLKSAFGENLTIDQLVEYLQSEKYRDIVAGAIYEGYRETNLFSAIERQKSILNRAAISCQSMCPNIAKAVQDCTYFMTITVQSTFSTRHIMQLFTIETNLSTVVNSIRQYDTIETAYADLADSIRASVQSIMASAAQDAYDSVSKIMILIVQSCLSKTDRELMTLFKLDRQLKLEQSQAPDPAVRLQRMDAFVAQTSHMFGTKDHDVMVKMITKMEQRLEADRKNKVLTHAGS